MPCMTYFTYGYTFVAIHTLRLYATLPKQEIITQSCIYSVLCIYLKILYFLDTPFLGACILLFIWRFSILEYVYSYIWRHYIIRCCSIYIPNQRNTTYSYFQKHRRSVCTFLVKNVYIPPLQRRDTCSYLNKVHIYTS